jgi:hypothetical protein
MDEQELARLLKARELPGRSSGEDVGEADACRQKQGGKKEVAISPKKEGKSFPTSNFSTFPLHRV